MPRNFAFASVGGLFHFGAQEFVAVDRVIDSDGRRCDEPPAPYPSRGVVRLRLQYLMTFALPRGTQRGGAFCLYAAIVQPTKWGATSAGTRRLPTSAHTVRQHAVALIGTDHVGCGLKCHERSTVGNFRLRGFGSRVRWRNRNSGSDRRSARTCDLNRETIGYRSSLYSTPSNMSTICSAITMGAASACPALG